MLFGLVSISKSKPATHVSSMYHQWQRSICCNIVVYTGIYFTLVGSLLDTRVALLTLTRVATRLESRRTTTHTIYYIVYEPRQRAAFRIPVKIVSFKSFDYRRHRACAIARLVELYTTYTTIFRQIERCPCIHVMYPCEHIAFEISSMYNPCIHVSMREHRI